MKIPTPFKLLQENPERLEFEAEFDLPHDDTPGCVNKLVVFVSMEDAEAKTCEVTLLSRTTTRDYIIGSLTAPVTSLAHLLYNFATIKMVPVLVLK